MGKKISLVKYLGKARNAEHYHLQEQMLAVVTDAFATKFTIKSIRDTYAAMFKKEDEAYLQSTAFEDTKQVTQKNTKRNDGLRYRYKRLSRTMQQAVKKRFTIDLPAVFPIQKH